MEDALPVLYRSVDDLSNLCVRIHLRKSSEAGAAEAVTAHEGDHARHDFDSKQHMFEFKWQQKVFGPRELLKIAGNLEDASAGRQPRGGFSPLQREYMSILQQRLSSGESVFDNVSNIMMFTYTDRDGYLPPSEIQRSLLSGQQPDKISALPSSLLTSAVLNPLANPKGVVAHAYKEKPYTTMYIMAAVGVNKEDYRAKKLSTQMYEVPLLCIKAFPPEPSREPGAPSTVTLEMRPGFTDTLPIDAAALAHIGAAGITQDSVLAAGRFGGELKLKTVTIPSTVVPELPPSITIRSPEGLAITAMVETHTFRTPDGGRYEYIVVNPSEDAATAVMASQAAAAVGDPALALVSTLTAPLPTLMDQSDQSATVAGATHDPLSSLIHAEQRAVESLSHRVAGDFHSAIPASLPSSTVRLSYFIELVSAAKFFDVDAVYIAWEVYASAGWTMLHSNADDESATANEYSAVDRAAAVQPRKSSDFSLASAHKSKLSSEPRVAGVTQIAHLSHRKWQFANTGLRKPEAGDSYHFAGWHRSVGRRGVTKRSAAFQSKPAHTSLACMDAEHLEDPEARALVSVASLVPVAHLCYPIEMHFACDSAAEVISSTPSIHFTIMSKDSLDRDHVVGYATYALSLESGSSSSTIPAWKPQASLREMESDFFLGSGQHIPGSARGEPRAGLASTTAGELGLRINTVKVVKPQRALAVSASDSAVKSRFQTMSHIISQTKTLRTASHF